jgi:glycosyltransferase involved in cell wall biosynthesis
VKVLLVGTGIHPIPPTGYGAVERILAEYAQALNEAGHPTQVVNEVRHGNSFDEYRFAMHLPSLIRREKYDVIHASTPVVANRLAGAGFSFVYTTHSRHWFWRESWRHRWGFWLERRAVRRAAATVALTPDVQAAIRDSFPKGITVTTRVIPYGINATGLAPAWDDRTGRRALGVGVVLPLKRWEVAAAALRGTGITLRIAGPLPDPAYAQRLRTAGDSVELLGEVDETRLRQLYAESDFLLHPSQVEVLPRAVLEAMASGLPVVGSSVVGSMFPGGRGALIAPSGATGQDLVRFFHDSTNRLAADPALRRAMAEAGRIQATTTYAWPRIVAEHVELYQQLGRPGR